MATGLVKLERIINKDSEFLHSVQIEMENILHTKPRTIIREHVRSKLYTWDQGVNFLLRIQKNRYNKGEKPLVFNIIMN